MKRQPNQRSHRKYEATSCHEIGYAWTIVAPAELETSVIELLQDALIEWSDDPQPRHILEVIKDHDDFAKASDRVLDLLRKVTFTAEVVHRDIFSQDFHEVT